MCTFIWKSGRRRLKSFITVGVSFVPAEEIEYNSPIRSISFAEKIFFFSSSSFSSTILIPNPNETGDIHDCTHSHSHTQPRIHFNTHSLFISKFFSLLPLSLYILRLHQSRFRTRRSQLLVHRLVYSQLSLYIYIIYLYKFVYINIYVGITVLYSIQHLDFRSTLGALPTARGMERDCGCHGVTK